MISAGRMCCTDIEFDIPIFKFLIDWIPFTKGFLISEHVIDVAKQLGILLLNDVVDLML